MKSFYKLLKFNIIGIIYGIDVKYLEIGASIITIFARKMRMKNEL